ncbi:MAG TPA: hypothetical protein VGQ24_07745 [Gemmatimonadales bacterium]|jgi:hypothetical protein|nr:hypothetical protein [Gemmatimonadales bacterium]
MAVTMYSRRGLVPVLLHALAALAGGGPLSAQDPFASIDHLPQARSRVDERRGTLTIDLPTLAVAAGELLGTPLFRASIPFEMSLHAFAVQVADDQGRIMPRDRLHHIVMTDPSRRQIFAPLALPIFGASKESPTPSLPRYLFGLPLPASNRYLVSAMFQNPETRPVKLHVRLVFSFIRPGRLFPLVRVYPWLMDVTFPLGTGEGRHAFDLPPGHSSRSWAGSPRIAGTVIAIGGHAHDFVTAIRMVDVTTGDTVYNPRPSRDAGGRLLAIPVARFYRFYRLGIRIDPSHIYRLTVEYDNPTGATIPFGGMGSVMGLVAPSRRAPWPRVDTKDSIYRTQIRDLLDNPGARAMGHASHSMP